LICNLECPILKSYNYTASLWLICILYMYGWFGHSTYMADLYTVLFDNYFVTFLWLLLICTFLMLSFQFFSSFLLCCVFEHFTMLPWKSAMWRGQLNINHSNKDGTFTTSSLSAAFLKCGQIHWDLYTMYCHFCI
jgi:hypothetical protein